MPKSEKINFINSALPEFLPSNSAGVLAVNRFVAQQLKEKTSENFGEIVGLPPIRYSREELEENFDFAENKYRFYLSILTKRLNEIHGQALPEAFWEKAINLGLYRHIVFFRDAFRIYEKHFDPEKLHAQKLSAKSLRTPLSYDEQRYFFQNAELGQEKIFSHYLEYAFPGRPFPVVVVREAKKSVPVESRKRKIDLAKSLIANKSVFNYLASKAGRLLRPRAKIRIAVIESFFSLKNYLALERKSFGAIRMLDLPKPVFSSNLNHEMREKISQFEEGFDRFDQFFFSSLRIEFPKMFLEDFSAYKSFYRSWFGEFSGLKWVCNESFMGDSFISLALAVVKQDFGIKHVYNEHNWLNQFYFGNSVRKLAAVVDVFFSLGWKDASISNLIPGGSLFEYAKKAQARKEFDALFVGGIAVARNPEFNGGNGFLGENAPNHIQFTQEFFRGLQPGTLGRIYYRPYPPQSIWLAWNLIPALGAFAEKMKVPPARSAKELMASSRLVIINYQSTAHVESLFANVPTIFFWDQKSYFMDASHRGFFDELIEAGICQINPAEAARFVEQIIDNPEEWWSREKTQRARKNFLDQNFGDPSKLTEFLLEKAKS